MAYVYVPGKVRKSPGCLSVLFHLFMVGITGGLWLIYLLVRYLLR